MWGWFTRFSFHEDESGIFDDDCVSGSPGRHSWIL